MGLDIFGTLAKRVRKSGVPFNMGIDEVEELANKRAVNRFKRFAKKELDILRSARDAAEYEVEYNNLFKKEGKMSKLTRYPFKYDYMVESIKPLEEVKEFFKVFAKDYYKECDVNLHKANFVYRYFEDKLEEERCFVSKTEVEDLVWRCEEVLKNPLSAPELLPTTSGFFFGGTDYDELYFDKVVRCKEQFTKVLKNFNENTDVFWMSFSW